MPNTNPPLDNEAMLNYVRTVAAREGAVRVFPIGCVTAGRKGEELADLNEMEMNGAVGFQRRRRAGEQSGNHAPGAGIQPRFQPARSSTTARTCSLTKGGQMNEGVVSLEMGLRGMPAAAEEIMVKRDLDLAKETGGHMHIAHVSTEGSVELIRAAKEQGMHVTAEVTPHHLTLTEEDVLKYGTLAKVNPPLRTKRDTIALLRALNDGVIDIVATDHAPHTEADKDCDLQPGGLRHQRAGDGAGQPGGTDS